MATAFSGARVRLVFWAVEPGRYNKFVLTGDAHTLDQFKNNSFGTAYTNVLDHVLYIDAFAAATHRVLQPQGSLFVDLNRQSLAQDQFAVHDLIAERAKIISTIKVAGFVKVLQSEFKYSRTGLLHQYVFRRSEAGAAQS